MKKMLLTVTVAALATTAHSSTFVNQFENGLRKSTRVAMNLVPNASGFSNVTQSKAVPTVTNVPNQFLKDDGVTHMPPMSQNVQRADVKPSFMDFIMPGFTYGLQSPVIEAMQKPPVQNFPKEDKGVKQRNLGFSKMNPIDYKPEIAPKPVMKEIGAQCEGGDFEIIQKKPVTHEIAIGEDKPFEVINKPAVKDMCSQTKSNPGSKRRNKGRPEEQDTDATLYKEAKDYKNQDIKGPVQLEDNVFQKGVNSGANHSFNDQNLLAQQLLKGGGINIIVNAAHGYQTNPGDFLNPNRNQERGFFSNLYSNIKTTIATGTSLGAIGGAGYFGVKYLVAHPAFVSAGLSYAWGATSFLWKASKWFR